MDTTTEIRRRINYLEDLIQKSDAVILCESGEDYREYYRHYQDVATYLNTTVDAGLCHLPQLIKPTIFNSRLGGLLTITIMSVLNPFLPF